jgi:hypothetical protein
MVAVLGLSAARGLTIESGKERPIMRVVRMLQDMQVELQKELDDDKAVHEMLTCWCKTNDREKTEAIELGNAKIDQLKSTMDEATAKMIELKEKRKQTMDEINSDHKALTDANELRIKENKAFQASETDLIEAVMACKQAVTVLGKHHADLAQVRAVVKKMQDAKVPQLVLASNNRGFTMAKMNLFKGFMEQAGSSSSFLNVPGFKGYAPQSGQIFGILKQMQEDFEANLSDAQKAEMKSKQDYLTLKAAKEEELAAGKEAVVQMDADLGEFGEKHAQAAQEYEDTQVQLGLDTEFLENLKTKCAASAAEYDVRVADRMEEIKAVEDTIGILNSDEAFENFGKTVTNPNSASFEAGTAFLQEIAVSQVEMGLRMRASAVLQRAGDANDSAKLQQLAFLAANSKLDSFTRVKQDIDKLVVELENQQKDEVAHRDWCTKELDVNERTTAAGDDKKASLEAKIADATKTIEGLTADIASTQAENAEMQKQMKRASEVREGENADYQQTVNDQRLTQQILQKAIERMMQVYEADELSVKKMKGEMMMQQPGAPHTQTSATHTDPGNGPAKFADNAEQHKGGSRVIAMLEEVAADSKKTEEEAMRSEDDSQAAYENFMKDSNKSISSNSESIANMSEAKAKAEGTLSMAKNDHKQTMKELEGLNDELGDLHTSCDFVLNNFDARQAARIAEMDALKQAKAILSGMK